MSDMQVQAELTLKDNMTKPAAKGLEEVAKSADKLQQSGKQRGADGRFLKQMAADGTAAARSMDAVGSETQQLQQQLKGAERSGSALRRTLSGVRDAGRDAAKHMAQMGKGLAAAKNTATAFGGGVMAAGYVAKTAMEKPIQYEQQLARAANTAYSDKEAPERIAGMKAIDATVKDAVRTGGGSREQGLEAYSSMLAGGLNKKTADKLMPTIMKASTASGASANELAAIMIKGIAQKQFTADEAEAAIDKAIKAGEAGGFELKDMARWLPQIISAGKGMKGMEGFEQHLANLQMVEKVTGSKDQAGNSYFNLLGKMFSQDTAKNFKDKGINITKVMGDAVSKGQDPVTAFVRATEEGIVGKNKAYKALKVKLDAAKDGDEKRAIMEQMAEILSGTAIGKVLQDREAIMGYIGVSSNKEGKAEMLGNIRNAEGTTDKSFATMQATTSFKAQQALNEKDMAQSAVLDTIKAPLDATLVKATRLAQENPLLATTAAGAATVGGMATAGGAAWGGMKLLQGAKGAAGTAAEVGTTAQAGTAVAARGGWFSKILGKMALPVQALVAGYDAYQTESNDALSRDQKNAAHMGTAGGFTGAMAGGAAGAALGSVVPVVGNIIGGILGSIAGYFGGAELGGMLGETIFSGDQQQTPQPATAQPIPVEQTFNQDITLEVDGEVLARKLAQYQTRESLRQ